jgi:hypothetical protein
MNKTALKTLIQGLEHRLELAAKKKEEEKDLFSQMSYHYVMLGLQTGIEDAKKLLDLEKQQIIEAVDHCLASVKLSDDKTIFTATTAEQYYHQTYNNE